MEVLDLFGVGGVAEESPDFGVEGSFGTRVVVPDLLDGGLESRVGLFAKTLELGEGEVVDALLSA